MGPAHALLSLLWQPSVVQAIPDPGAPVGVSGAGGPERRRRWWWPAPEPTLDPITTKRAYTEVLLVFSGFFLSGVAAAAFLLANRSEGSQAGSWAIYFPSTIDIIAQTGVAVAVVLLLAARRGVTTKTLGLSLPHRSDGRFASGATVRILAWALFAQIIGGVINAALQSGDLPTVSKPNAAILIFSFFRSVNAGVVEELVVLAFVVVTLRQARRPWWEVTLVALVLRGSYHIYYGPGVFGILVWAAIFYWLYLRTRSLILLMTVHFAWDAVSFFSARWDAVAVVGSLVTVGIWVAAGISWLVERNNGPNGAIVQPHPAWAAGAGTSWWQPGGGGGPAGSSAAGLWGPASGTPPAAPGAVLPDAPVDAGPAPPVGTSAPPVAWAPHSAQLASAPAPAAISVPPGWQPDPSGANRWRWWDGYRWTDHVSGSGPAA
jgi:membrane protease YdiL (CAAX protease family)